LWWEIIAARPLEAYLVPQNGAQIAIFGTTLPSCYDCARLRLSTEPIRGDQIPTGTILCALTNEGRYAMIHITDYGYDLEISYLTWEWE
jgi:hypothetical protein